MQSYNRAFEGSERLDVLKMSIVSLKSLIAVYGFKETLLSCEVKLSAFLQFHLGDICLSAAKSGAARIYWPGIAARRGNLES